MGENNTVDAGIAYALGVIRTRFEDNSDPDNDMPFHNVEHTRGVIKRARALMLAMGADQAEIDAGVLGAAFHDVVQRWETNNTPDGRALRKRFVGQNEKDSAAEGVAWLKAHGVLNDRQRETVVKAIMGTVPAWDQQNATVAQPQVPADASPAVRAVALADLGIPGMDGGKDYVATGDDLFREENLDVLRTLRASHGRADVAAATLDGYKTRVLNWCKGQASYARGRRARLPVELGDLNGSARSAVEALFCKFDESIAAAEEALRQREGLSPWDVLKATGYAIPPG